jgi:transposase
MTEHEELLMLRKLVEKQQQELAKKEHDILKKEQTIERLSIQVENMLQALLHARKKLFGASSEITSTIAGQQNLFATTSELAKELLAEQKKVTIAPYTRKPRQPGVRAEMLDALPKEIEEYIVDPEENCSVCGSELKVVGKKLIRTEVELVPAKLKVKQIVQQVVKCTKCGTKESENPKDHFQKAAVPASLLSHSIATPSLVAQVMYQKFAMGIPLNRQESDFHRMGLILPRSNMAHWVIRCCDEWLLLIYNLIHDELLKCEIIHMDETRFQVLKEKDRRAETDSFMWLYRSGEDGLPSIILYEYSPTRSGSNAAKFVSGFSGYLACDGYTGYNKVPEIKRCCCWAHVRRYFIDAVPKGHEYDYSNPAVQGVRYCSQLFELEEHFRQKGYSYEKRKELRLKKEKPLLEAFWCWLDNVKPLKNSRLDKAVQYALNRKPYLEIYLEDGRCSISNNLSENAIRPFTVGRKGWLFCDTPAGAEASAIVYSIVEMAKANQLNIYRYLAFLLSKRPSNGLDEIQLELLALWGQDAIAQCKE